MPLVLLSRICTYWIGSTRRLLIRVLRTVHSPQNQTAHFSIRGRPDGPTFVSQGPHGAQHKIGPQETPRFSQTRRPEHLPCEKRIVLIRLFVSFGTSFLLGCFPGQPRRIKQGLKPHEQVRTSHCPHASNFKTCTHLRASGELEHDQHLGVFAKFWGAKPRPVSVCIQATEGIRCRKAM